MKEIATALGLAFLASNAQSHEYVTIEELTDAMDFAGTGVRTEALAPGLHVLFGVGGNVVVSIGDQGVLMVDSQYAPMVPFLEEAIRGLGGKDVDFVVNTHWHFDHAGGNPALGRNGTWFVSQRNSRRMLAGEQTIDTVTSPPTLQSPSPDEAMPVVTYRESMQMHFNGDTIDLL
ncbi:MAG: MBL fold metallo-hydrolase, partial [Gammaproteobacteria bacterium]|nr:MBL fold metallo-hydrolase [Gammaproteobacteria bacterium]